LGKGKLITFESGECGGKDTQIALLRDYLIREGHTVSPLYWEPGSTLKSEVIRLLLKNKHNSDFVFPGDFIETFDLEKYKDEFSKERIPYFATLYLHKALVLMHKSKNELKSEVVNFLLYNGFKNNEFEKADKLPNIIKDLNMHPSPKGTPAEMLLSQYFSKEVLSAESQLYLYMADRNIMYHNILPEALANYDFAILNRSKDSSKVYQGHAQNPELLPLIDKLNIQSMEGIVPYSTYLLDLDMKELLDRYNARILSGKHSGITKDFFDEKDASFHENIRNGYLMEAEYHRNLPKNHPEYNRIKVIDGKGPVEVVHKRIVDCLTERINQK
jgi:thymidylate kinase